MIQEGKQVALNVKGNEISPVMKNLKIQSFNKALFRPNRQHVNLTQEDSFVENVNFGQFTIDSNPHMEAVSKGVSIPGIKQRKK